VSLEHRLERKLAAVRRSRGTIRFFATHRYIAYARLVRVEPRDGAAYSVRAAGPVT